jgi:predicted metal-dependent RNase
MNPKSLNHRQGAFIVIAGSGMATGGRVVHHLKERLPDPKTTVLLAGFQAVGTRGRSLQDGAKTVRMHGQEIPVRAHIEVLDGLSAHADQRRNHALAARLHTATEKSLCRAWRAERRADSGQSDHDGARMVCRDCKRRIDGDAMRR